MLIDKGSDESLVKKCVRKSGVDKNIKSNFGKC